MLITHQKRFTTLSHLQVIPTSQPTNWRPKAWSRLRQQSQVRLRFVPGPSQVRLRFVPGSIRKIWKLRPKWKCVPTWKCCCKTKPASAGTKRRRRRWTVSNGLATSPTSSPINTAGRRAGHERWSSSSTILSLSASAQSGFPTFWLPCWSRFHKTFTVLVAE